MASKQPTTDFVHLNPRDSVVVCLRDFSPGDCVSLGTQSIVVRDNVPAGHKLAIQEIPSDSCIYKFGWAIGRASQAIAPGEHVHSHNLQCDHTVDLEAISTEIPPAPEPLQNHTFSGYVRPDGSVGTRNYLAVISNVNCSASVHG